MTTTDTFAKLDDARDALNSIDLRSLRGEPREAVKAARAAVANATTVVRAAQTAALVDA